MTMVKKKYFDVGWWKLALMSRGRDYVASVGFKPRIEELEVNGVRFHFYVATPLSQNWYARSKSLSSEEISAFSALMPLEGATLVECGGHHGRDCVVLSNLIGKKGCASFV